MKMVASGEPLLVPRTFSTESSPLRRLQDGRGLERHLALSRCEGERRQGATARCRGRGAGAQSVGKVTESSSRVRSSIMPYYVYIFMNADNKCTVSEA